MTRLSLRAAAQAPALRPASSRHSTLAAERQAQGEAQAERLAGQALAGPLPAGGPRRPMARPAAPGAWPRHLPAATQAVLQARGEPLPAAVRADLEPRLGCDFSQVRVHHDQAAARSAQALSAQAYAVGTHLVFDTGRYAPGSLAGRSVLAHELSHVMQQTVGGLGPLLQRLPTQLADIPEAERRALQMGTIEVNVPAQTLTEFFTLMPSGRPSASQSIGGVSNSFGSGIATALQTGLGSVSAYLVNTTNALPLNSSVEVALDLSAHGGGHHVYRFTYFSHTEGRGSSATRGPVMLIEQLGAVPATPAAAQTAVSGSFSVNGSSFSTRGSWNDADYTVLHQALSLLPDAARTEAAGLVFRRVSAAVGDEAGRYLPDTDTVELNNRAFPPASALRVGEAAPAVRTVLHEIGHAVDLRSLETAWRAFNAAGQSAAARRTFLAARSASGTRYTAADGGDYAPTENAADAAPAFRAAVARDGVRRDTSGSRTSTDAGEVATLQGGVTRYSDTDYEELYAESFSLYMSAPETLRQLRPATYAYFLARFPRPAAAAGGTTPATGTGAGTSTAPGGGAR